MTDRYKEYYAEYIHNRGTSFIRAANFKKDQIKFAQAEVRLANPLTTEAKRGSVVSEAVNHTTAAVYGAFQGECFQFGDQIFHNRWAASIDDYRTRPILGIYSQLQHEFPLNIVNVLQIKLNRKAEAYQLLGVFHHDRVADKSTVVLGGNISWESGQFLNDQKSLKNPRTNSPTAICMQFNSVDTGEEFLAALQEQPNEILESYLRADKFSGSWLGHNNSSSISRYQESGIRKNTPIFKFEIDKINLVELTSPFVFTERSSIGIPR